jgi:hypothetical protein
MATGEALYSRFLGRWQGSLEYRDFSTNKRVTLPTLLDISLSPDRKAMIWQFTYDDGPGKIVSGSLRSARWIMRRSNASGIADSMRVWMIAII